MAIRLKAVLRPEAFLLAAAITLANWNRVERAAAGAIPFAPAAVGIAGLFVAWQLRRSRLVFALAVLTGAYLLILRRPPGDATAFQLVALLVPINFAAIAVLPERGVFTTSGLWHWAALLTQAAAVSLLFIVARPETARPILEYAFFAPPPRFAALMRIGQPALVTFVAAVAVTGAARLFAPGTTGAGFLWALAAVFLAFQARETLDRTLYLATTGGLLVTTAIERSYVLAYHDGLTGLPGRRALNEALDRLSGGFTIAMADVDHFKRFNDTYGHDVGDQVLRTVAGRLARSLPGGEAFRYGGEEFAVLFPGKSLEACVPLLDAAREAVAAEQFTVRHRLRPRKRPSKPRTKRAAQRETVTVSIGVAERDGEHQEPEQVIEAADKALYRAKQGGRNQVQT